MQHVRFALAAAGLALVLFIGMLLFLELGRRFGNHQIARHGKDARAGVGVVDGAVYGILGLLIGFMFSGAASRFDQRRQLIAQEAILFKTAWQRLDLVPREAQPKLRADFRQYVDAVLDWYVNPRGAAKALREPDDVVRAREAVWLNVAAVSQTPAGDSFRMLVMPALSDVFAAVERERLTRRIHPAPVTFLLLCFTALAAALFGGYGLAGAPTRNWIHVIGVAATIALAMYVIIDLEFPRLGLVRVRKMDQTLVELRASME